MNTFNELETLVFSPGTDLFKNYSRRYHTHAKGLFILAPSGAGKTYFCQRQAQPHWIDGDELWMAARAQPEGPWWKASLDIINEIDQRCDVITAEARRLGFWIMGASNFWLKPDAIVIPNWETHKTYIAHRQQHGYDGGATADDHEQVLGHIKFIESWHHRHNVPRFDTIEAAVEQLTT